MVRKSLISLLFAVALMALLTVAVGAQSVTEEATPAAPSIQPMGGGIVQAIPLTLTVNVTDADGEIMTVEVPIVLSLDIQIALGNVLTTSVVVTPEQVTEITPTVAAVTPTVAATVAPTRAAPTATPIPATATPAATATEAAPTPAPVGQTPEATEEPTAEPEPEEEATPVGDEEPTPEPVAIDPDACSDARSVITSPGAGEVVSGTVEVLGTARHELFNYYKLEYQQIGTETSDFAFIMDSANQVENGVLADLDTTELDNGEYVLRLTVVDNTGNFPPQCLVPVQIAN